MSTDKKTFNLKFLIGESVEETHEVSLEHITENMYTDGVKIFELTESFLYVIEKTEKSKKKKKRVAKRKGKDLVLSNKKDKIIFSPEAVVNNNTRTF